MLEPCGWEATPCETCCDDALATLDSAVKAVLEAQAVSILWSATGKQYGLCETVLRPCRRECGSFWGGLPFPVRVSGEWLNISCGACLGSCGCSIISDFLAEDTDSVVSVKVDGEELIPCETVMVYDRRRLVRVDGEAWPTCQDLSLPDTEAGTWSVTVNQGKPVPAGGEVMAGILLCELAKACVGDDECRLPRRVQTVTRQGITVGFQDMFENVDKVLTGIYEVDLWIEAARQDLYPTARILSPDLPRASVLTWPLEGDCNGSE